MLEKRVRPEGKTKGEEVEEALDYWLKKDPLDGRAKMENSENKKVGCAYKVVEPLVYFVCAYVSLPT
ncbi:hypothetical protein Y032_0181g870 [Ancylostoma ceylanicum]|uniref:SCP domain-containing protein n=1 Tax=Ancylostoma ceylanicum TaxID=53326 RepID=A0A016SSA0_9BILA|nr:hypothetical protein Y032_0181g870 [Ancylostoma ceylanicum]